MREPSEVFAVTVPLVVEASFTLVYITVRELLSFNYLKMNEGRMLSND